MLVDDDEGHAPPEGGGLGEGGPVGPDDGVGLGELEEIDEGVLDAGRARAVGDAVEERALPVEGVLDVLDEPAVRGGLGPEDLEVRDGLGRVGREEDFDGIDEN